MRVILIYLKSLCCKVKPMQQNHELPEPAAIVASVIHLMTRHAVSGCPQMGRMVIRQLEYLAHHPSEQITPMLRQVCNSLIVEWYNVIYQMHKAEDRAALH